MRFAIVGVMVPRLALAAIHLHDAHSSFDKAAGEQTVPAKGSPREATIAAGGHQFGLRAHQAIGRLGCWALLADIESGRRGALHIESHFERLNAGVHCILCAPAFFVHGIQALNQVEFAALRRRRKLRVLQVRNHLARVVVFGQRDLAALINAGQKTTAPVRGAVDRLALFAQDDKARQVFILAAEPIEKPGTVRWTVRLNAAGKHHPIR